MSYAITPRLVPGTEAFRVWTMWLGHRLAEEGPAPYENHVTQFAAMAEAQRVEPELTAVLADADGDDVGRARAFFVVATALDALVPA